MTWGFFTASHILSLIFVPIFVVLLHCLLRNHSVKTQTLVLFPLSLWGVASIVFNLFYWGVPLENLPLHLCSFNAVALPLVVLSKNKTFGNVLLVWCLGAAAALVLNNEMAVWPFASWPIFFYYWPHLVEIAIPIVLVSLKLVKKDPKCIFSTIAITMSIYTVVHFINLAINNYCIAHNILDAEGDVVFANYMYSLAPNNPLVELFMKWIPGGYWHMYLAVPILVVYLLIVYAPEIIGYFKNKKCSCPIDNGQSGMDH